MAKPAANSESARVRSIVIEAADRAADLVATPEIAAHWDKPSSLEGMTVGALAAHLIRATGAVVAYLERTDPNEQPEEILTRITYFRAALEAPIHDRIKQVSATESEPGAAELAAKARRVADGLAGRLLEEPIDRLIGALEGRMVTLDDFCRTRMIEIGMHLDDLAFSVGLPTPEVEGAADGIIEILMGIARQRHGDWGVIHALGRRERLTDPVFPVF